MNDSPARGVVGLLTAQALAFGMSLALLLIPANSLFLDAYGSEWLPATYIAIAIVGSVASAFIARAARRVRLVRVATASLGGLAALFGVSWVILAGGGEWMSAVLLVLFPIALQIGFVFLGGQAGRLLDVRQMKALFPRVLSGFAVGFLVGGLVAIPLLALLGSTTNLMLATTAAQLAFLALVIVTERRFPEVRIAPVEDAPPVVRPPMRLLFASGLTLLLLVYQVLSAMGSQVVDFLLFDRAAAQYTGEDLTRFLSAYTAVLNVVDILVLALVAGPLLRRFGLRLGLVLNPAVVAVLLAAMTVVAAGPGAASFGLFALAGLLRIADIAATDGTTRTSINAAYQVVPAQDRLAVQAVVEGIGVPVAIGATGVLLLLLEALDLGTSAVIVFGLVLSVIWTVVAMRVYRSYARGLTREVGRRTLRASALDDSADEASAIHRLLGSNDVRDVRLGLDLLAGAVSPAADAELRRLAEHADRDVRVLALAQLAVDGDAGAAADLDSVLRELARSGDAIDRRAAARVLTVPGIPLVARDVLPALLDDPDATVRGEALSAVDDVDAASPEVVRLVVAAVGDRRHARRAIAALRRLGDVAAVAPALDDPDRAIVLGALETLTSGGTADPVDPDVLETVLRDAAAHARRATGARAALATPGSPLDRALEDEIDLARRLAIAVLTLRHGDAIGDAVRVVDHAQGQRRALGVETLDVTLSREETELVFRLLVRDLAPGEHVRTPGAWLAELAEDPEGVWRSEWLAACARHATSVTSG